jgi:hypothetical protein
MLNSELSELQHSAITSHDPLTDTYDARLTRCQIVIDGHEGGAPAPVAGGYPRDVQTTHSG